MKTCSRCLRTLPKAEFHKPDFSWCKPCRADYDRGKSRSNSRDPRRNATEAAKARKRRWALQNRDPIKERARRLVRAAILSGGLSVPKRCPQCHENPKRIDGVRGIQAHHDDYSKPLDVRWLCSICHTKEHAAKEQSNG